MGYVRRIAHRTGTLFFLVLLAAAIRCAGEDAGGNVIPGPDVADVTPEVAPPPPECDPSADPTGCEDGALCWFARCGAIARVDLASSPGALVGAVASLADEKGGAVVAWHERIVTSDEAGADEAGADEAGAVTARADAIYASFLQGAAPGPPIEVARWDVAPADGTSPGPRLLLTRDPGGGVTIVRGPEPLVAYRWQDGVWAATAPFSTGARLVGSEGSMAAAYDGAGLLHVAYHDTQTETDSLDVATLAPDGSWSATPVFDLAGHYDAYPWGSRVAAASLAGRVVFAHILSSELDPSVRRGAVVVEQTDSGWEVSKPSLADGLVIEGRVMGFAASVDPGGRLTLAWLPHTRQLGFAVRGDDGRWNVERYLDASDTNVSEDVFENVAVRWWQDAVVFAWLGFPQRECSCFDLRMAMFRGGEWLEYRVERYADYAPGDFDLAVDGEGRVLLPVGGGAFPAGGTAAPMLYTGDLPDWSAP